MLHADRQEACRRVSHDPQREESLGGRVFANCVGVKCRYVGFCKRHESRTYVFYEDSDCVDRVYEAVVYDHCCGECDSCVVWWHGGGVWQCGWTLGGMVRV